jgi:hypothetical protein
MRVVAGVWKLRPRCPWDCGEFLANPAESQSPAVKPLPRSSNPTRNNQEWQLDRAKAR